MTAFHLSKNKNSSKRKNSAKITFHRTLFFYYYYFGSKQFRVLEFLSDFPSLSIL